MKWNKLTVREITEEDKEICQDCSFMWEGAIPEIWDRVLVSQNKVKQDAYIDEWVEFDDNTIGFEDTNVDVGEVIYWVNIPEIEVDND